NRLRQGLHDWQATGSRTYQTYYLGLLAELLIRNGRGDEARQTLDEALDLVHQTRESLYESELHRLRGEAMLRDMDQPDLRLIQRAEETLRHALEIAHRQETLSYELRAAMSLFRSSRQTGHDRFKETRELLAAIFERFTEGFETSDLREARGLLSS